MKNNDNCQTNLNTKNTHIQLRMKKDKKDEIKYLSSLCKVNMSQFIMDSIEKNINSLRST